MSNQNNPPTPYPEVNAILQKLLVSVQSVLGSHFTGMYVEGSLTSGDFDRDSDIDFVAVTDQEITENFFSALQAIHERIAKMDSWYAIQLEGSYISAQVLRRHDPALTLHLNIERGKGERLKWAVHDETWNIHRFILRERGITLIGPDPKKLIDPVSPNGLRRAMLPALQVRATQILNHPDVIKGRGYQSYIVLSLCRILYTLQFGDVVSKPKAAQWAKQTLDEKWIGLIDRAWVGRQQPQLAAEPGDILQTLDFIRFALERSRRMEIPPES